MTTDQTAPATKQDIALLMEQMGSYYMKTESKIQRLKADMVFHTEVLIENLRHDLLGAQKDEITSIKTRLRRVERKVGLS
jgi:hypothetical protein